MANVFNETCEFLSALRGASKGSQEALNDILSRPTFGDAMKLTSGKVSVKGIDRSMIVSKFVEKLFNEDATLMDNLKSTLPSNVFKELQSTVRAAWGLSEISVEVVSMMKDMRKSMEELADKTMRQLNEAATTKEKWINALNEAAKAGKESKLVEAWKNLEAGLEKVSKGPNAFISSKFFAAMPIPRCVTVDAYELLGTWANAYSGCYMFDKQTKEKCRVDKLSQILESTHESCFCELTDATTESPNYQNFVNGRFPCQQALCVNESFKSPYDDKSRYTFSCIQLNRWDALCVVAVDIESSIVDTLKNIASVAFYTILPVSLMCGGIYMTSRLYLNRSRNSSAEKSVEKIRQTYITSDEKKKKGKVRRMRRNGYVR
ncbi:hypothetical protein LissoIVSPER_00033 [Lissonota sp. PSUC_FEM 10030012]|nr:hypothetical protein [Lissonota sp. PSUC_FEM 10030012]